MNSDQSTSNAGGSIDDFSGTTRPDGGFEVKDLSELRNTDELIRKYSTPPGDTLYAHHSSCGDHHIVASRGSEPATRWEKQIPATAEYPVPGLKRWTIPDNWEQRIISNRDSIKYALYYVPESDIWAMVSIPTNDWLVDAWYNVVKVGDLAVNPVGELGSTFEVRQLASNYDEENDYDGAEEDKELLWEVAYNWDSIETDLHRALEWVRGDGLDQMATGDMPVHADQDWQIEFHRDMIFRPGEAIKRAVDLSIDPAQLSHLLEILREADLLPSPYSFELSINDSEVGMEYYIQGMVENGASAAEALDYYMVEIKGMTQTEWARERGVDQSAVSKNVKEAKSHLDT
jgi:hypothetical protein